MENSTLERLGANRFKDFESIAIKNGAEVESILDVPVFTISNSANIQAVSRIIESFGEGTVMRVINSHFVGDAIEFGTDRAGIDEHDFRSIINYITGGTGYGHDVWGVENRAAEEGLKREDVFCGTPYDGFKRRKGYDSIGLGIPSERSAVLIFDGNKVKKIEDTDGYAFTESKNKKNALLGIVRFNELIVTQV